MARQTRSERRARRAAQAESRASVDRAPQQRAPQPARAPAEAAKPASDAMIRRGSSEAASVYNPTIPIRKPICAGVIAIATSTTAIGHRRRGPTLGEVGRHRSRRR